MRPTLRYVLLLTGLLAASAFAALGGSVESTSATSAAPTPTNNQPSIARTQLRSTTSNGYTVHESITGDGITVREYASPQGIVFAVSWKGPGMPDLAQLLGAYFPQFKIAVTERRRRGVRGPVSLQQEDLVVESRGHLRDFKGRAYVPSLLPPQVSIEEIQ